MASYFSTFPDFDEYSVVDLDRYQPSIMNGLKTVVNQVTTLNILPQARSTAFSADDVDGYIWACRGLRTLHMTVASETGNYRPSPETSGVLSVDSIAAPGTDYDFGG
ncbi:hypothetical protein BGW39_011291 [Mortierella sp. 14UC]|nr:hypothetical protein BGW39_011291 [Mortierella sp. 14UC]